MDNTFDFGSESPILWKHPTKSYESEGLHVETYNLEELHNRLLQHMKKGASIPRDELKTFLSQAEKMNPECHKTRRLLMKIKTLLKLILKKRSDFQDTILKEEIPLHEKLTPAKCSPDFQSDEDLPLDLLTNDNFVTIKSEQNVIKTEMQTQMSVENIESLKDFAKENYEMLKSLTGATGDQSCFVNSEAAPQLEEVYQMHDLAWNDSLMQIVSQPENDNFNKRKIETDEDYNIFDNLNLSNDELKEEFNVEYEQTRDWMDMIVENLDNLQVEEKVNCFDISCDKGASFNETFNATANTTALIPMYDEENVKIIREVCSQFKKELENSMKKDKELEVLREFINF